jgi:O-antigen ligase
MTTASYSTAATYLRAEPAERGLWLLAGFALLVVAAASGYSLAVHELEALYVTIAVMACVAILFDFRIGAVLLLVLLPAADTTVVPRSLMGITGLNHLNLLLGGTLLSYLLRGRLTRTGRFLPWPLLFLYIVPITLAGLHGMRYAQDIVPYFYEMEVVNFSDAAGYLRDMVVRPLILVMVALVLAAAVARSQKPERFILAIAISVWLIALLQIAFVVSSGVRIGWLASSRARSFFDAMGIHANDLGRMYMVAYALLLFVWWETKRQALKNFLFATMGVLCFGLLLTFSRGAFVGFMLVNLWMLAWKFNAKSVSLAVLALTLAAVLLPGAVYTRMSVGFDTGEADAVSAGRIESIWLPLLPEVKDSPLWGHGLGSIMWSTPMENGSMLPVGHAHNAYLEAVLDMGVIGLGLLLAFFWHVWQGFRSLGSNAYLSPELRGFFQGATAGLLAFLLTGMAGSSLRPTGEFGYLWVAIGMMYGVLARRPNP